MVARTKVVAAAVVMTAASKIVSSTIVCHCSTLAISSYTKGVFLFPYLAVWH